MKSKSPILSLSCALGIATLASPSFAQEDIEGFEARTYTSADGVELPYRLFVPENYDPNTAYPLITFLHGVGEVGTNNVAQIEAGDPNGAMVWSFPEHQAQAESFVLAPQCPDGQWVDVSFGQGSYSIDEVPMTDNLMAVDELIDQLQTEFNIDPSRLYLTGLSMGGYGTWDLALRRPDKFAAVAPLCGGGDPSHAEDLSGVPIWAFHGAQDGTVPVEGSREMVDALEHVDCPLVTYTEYPDLDHFIWDPTYSNEEFISWMLEQQMGAALPPGCGASTGSGGTAGASSGGSGSGSAGSAGSGTGVSGSGGMSSAGSGGATSAGAPQNSGAKSSQDSGSCAFAARPTERALSLPAAGLLALLVLRSRRRRAAQPSPL